ncbi:MAG: signal peptidase I [Patescibacteria group bacterium]
MSFIYQEVAENKQIRRRLKPNIIEEVIDYLWYFFRIFVVTALFFTFIKTSVFDIVTVSGRSMYPTYDNGNQLNIDLLTPNFGEYRRGDVVIIKIPSTDGNPPVYYIKRIIGLPGDTVILENGAVTLVNSQFDKGILLDETKYLPPTTKTYKLVNTGGERVVEPTLKSDEYYVLGDNRTASKDSRSFGPVQRKNILGREIYRISPAEKRGFFNVPTYGDVPN